MLQTSKEPAGVGGAKVLFEIYRDSRSGFRVVYFTELDEHTREDAIDRAMAGEHVFDGFIAAGDGRAKERIGVVLERLNAGEAIDAVQIEIQLEGLLIR